MLKFSFFKIACVSKWFLQKANVLKNIRKTKRIHFIILLFLIFPIFLIQDYDSWRFPFEHYLHILNKLHQFLIMIYSYLCFINNSTNHLHETRVIFFIVRNHYHKPLILHSHRRAFQNSLKNNTSVSAQPFITKSFFISEVTTRRWRGYLPHIVLQIKIPLVSNCL